MDENSNKATLKGNFQLIDGGRDVLSASITAFQINIKDKWATDWKNLFRGFNELHVVTYSLGLRQVQAAMEYFDCGDVIIGSPSQIRQKTAELFAEQEFNLKSIGSL